MVRFWSRVRWYPSWSAPWSSASALPAVLRGRQSVPIKAAAEVMMGLLVLLTPADVYASPFSSTPSDAVYEDPESAAEDQEEELEEPEELEEWEESDVETGVLDTVYDYFMERLASDFTGPGVEEPDPQDEALELLGDVSALSENDDPMAYSLRPDDSVINVLRYDVVVSGVSYVLLLPPGAVDQVFIDSGGYLWNAGTSSIQGRLFEDSFDPTADTGLLLTLGPCLGNNFSDNHEYGSPNYVREYYWDDYYDRIRYDTTYVTVQVEGSSFPFHSSDTLVYVIIILLGGVLLCLWKKSLR